MRSAARIRILPPGLPPSGPIEDSGAAGTNISDRTHPYSITNVSNVWNMSIGTNGNVLVTCPVFLFLTAPADVAIVPNGPAIGGFPSIRGKPQAA